MIYKGKQFIFAVKIYLILFMIFSLAATGQAANYTWKGSDGNWTDNSNWTGGSSHPDNYFDTAVIGAGNVTLSGEPFAMVGSLDMNGHSLNLTNASTLWVKNLNNTGDIFLSGASTLNAPTSNNVTINGSGSIFFGSGDNRLKGGIRTVGSSQTVTTSSGGYGCIESALTNNGLVSANDGTINISRSGSSITNNNIMEAVSGGILDIHTSVVNIDNASIESSSGMVNLWSSGSSSPTIINGTLSGSGFIIKETAKIRGVKLSAAALDVADKNLIIESTIIGESGSAIELTSGHGQASLTAGSSQTTELAGDIMIQAAAGDENYIETGTGASMTLGDGAMAQAVDGATLNITGSVHLEDTAEIQAKGPGSQIVFSGAEKQNKGKYEADNGGILNIQAAIDNTNGEIVANTGSTVSIRHSGSSSATIRGGILDGTGGGNFNVDESATLQDLQLNAAKLNIMQDEILTLRDGIQSTNHSVIQSMRGAKITNMTSHDATLSGEGVLEFSSTQESYLSSAPGGKIILGSGFTVRAAEDAAGVIDGTFHNQGSISVMKNGSLDIRSGSFDNYEATPKRLSDGNWGVYTDEQAATLDFGRNIEKLSAHATLSGKGAKMIGLDVNEIEGHGDFTITQGAEWASSGDVVNHGSMTVGQQAKVTVHGAYTQESGRLILEGGLLEADNGIDIQQGDFGGVGDVSGPATIGVGASLSPGFSPGIMNFNNDLTVDGIIKMELAGADNSSEIQYDQIVVDGIFNINGTVDVILLDSFIPESGDFFDLFFADEINWEGALFDIPVLAQGLSWEWDEFTLNEQEILRLNVTGNMTVPIPGSILLLGSGIAVILLRKKIF